MGVKRLIDGIDLVSSLDPFVFLKNQQPHYFPSGFIASFVEIAFLFQINFEIACSGVYRL
jgi:hypothetical protein